MATPKPITSQSGTASAAAVAAQAKRTPPTAPPLTSIRSGQPKVTATTGGTRLPSAIAEAEQGDQNDRQGRLERLLGRQHDGALAHLLADAPQQRAGLGALGGDAQATLEWLELGGDRERPLAAAGRPVARSWRRVPLLRRSGHRAPRCRAIRRSVRWIFIAALTCRNRAKRKR